MMSNCKFKISLFHMKIRLDFICLMQGSSQGELRKFSKIFSKFKINRVFSPNAQRINAWFLKFFENFLVISNKLCFSCKRAKIESMLC